VAVVSRHGERIHFCLFDARSEKETHRFALPRRLGDVHFSFIAGIGAGMRSISAPKAAAACKQSRSCDEASNDPIRSGSRTFMQRPNLPEEPRHGISGSQMRRHRTS
jgi:pullulanase/glycogen debranching enzyme